jgi:L-histidine N-alpha-methyltransferase
VGGEFRDAAPSSDLSMEEHALGPLGVRVGGTCVAHGPLATAFAGDVRDGLSSPRKRLPCRWLYDEAGSALFEQICGLSEYYIPAAEREILHAHADEIAASVPPGAELIELGAGSARKTRILIDALLARAPSLRYVPVDLSAPVLETSTLALRAEYPRLDVRPLLATYDHAIHRLAVAPSRPKLVVWLGSSIGNLARVEAAMFLRNARLALRPADRVLVGIDLRKDPAKIRLAYDDARGITARFNKNLLLRVNRQLGGRFDAERFRHVATYHEDDGRLEMTLVSELPVRVEIEDLELEVRLGAGETIHTEDSYKYSHAEIAALGWAAGFSGARQWVDRAGLFSANLFAP